MRESRRGAAVSGRGERGKEEGAGKERKERRPRDPSSLPPRPASFSRCCHLHRRPWKKRNEVVPFLVAPDSSPSASTIAFFLQLRATGSKSPTTRAQKEEQERPARCRERGAPSEERKRKGSDLRVGALQSSHGIVTFSSPFLEVGTFGRVRIHSRLRIETRTKRFGERAGTKMVVEGRSWASRFSIKPRLAAGGLNHRLPKAREKNKTKTNSPRSPPWAGPGRQQPSSLASEREARRAR